LPFNAFGNSDWGDASTAAINDFGSVAPAAMAAEPVNTCLSKLRLFTEFGMANNPKFSKSY
jgi:hypothetical protein